MIPVTQTKGGGRLAPPEERGDCFDACLASILEVPIEVTAIPHDEQWWDYAVDVVARQGFRLFEAYRLDALEGTDFKPLTAAVLGEWIGDVYWIASVPSRNLPGERHVVVMRGGDVVHDPSLGEGRPLGPLGDDVPIFSAELLFPLAGTA